MYCLVKWSALYLFMNLTLKMTKKKLQNNAQSKRPLTDMPLICGWSKMGKSLVNREPTTWVQASLCNCSLFLKSSQLICIYFFWFTIKFLSAFGIIFWTLDYILLVLFSLFDGLAFYYCMIKIIIMNYQVFEPFWIRNYISFISICVKIE